MSFTRVLIGFAEKPKRSFRWSFCKTMGCSYVTLLTTYLAKKKNKTMFQVSYRNTRKRCLLILKITLKTEQYHLTTSYLPEVTIQNHILWTVCNANCNCSLPSVLLSSSMACNFNNSRPICHYMRNNYRTIWLMKNSKCQHFLLLNKRYLV